MSEQLRFRRGGATAEELQAAVDEALAELGERDDVPERIEVAEDAHGADPLTTAIIITIVGNLGSEAALAAWRAIWRRVRDSLGDDALGEPEDAD